MILYYVNNLNYKSSYIVCQTHIYKLDPQIKLWLFNDAKTKFGSHSHKNQLNLSINQSAYIIEQEDTTTLAKF